MARLVQALGIAAIALCVAACGATKKKQEPSNADKYDGESGGLNVARLFGVAKTPPDEFAVIAKKPLEMPQDLAALPPPQPGERSLRNPDPVVEARTLLLGESANTPQAANVRTSASEAALLDAAGASDPTIRATLAADQRDYESEQGLYVLDSIIPGLRSLRGEDTKDLVDPIEERQRLNTAAGGAAARAARETEIAVIPGPASGSRALPTQPAPAVVPSQTEPQTGGELIYIPE